MCGVLYLSLLHGSIPGSRMFGSASRRRTSSLCGCRGRGCRVSGRVLEVQQLLKCCREGVCGCPCTKIDVRVRPRGRSSRTAKASWNAHSTPLPQRRLQRRCSGAWRAYADQPVNLRQHSSSCLSVSAGLWEFFSASVTTSSAHPTWH